MPRQYNIKWRQQDFDKLKKTVNNFNAKITRTIKKNPALESVLPEKLKANLLKKQILTRKDFNKTIARLERFNKRRDATKIITNERGVISTKWELNEARLNVKNLNQQRAYRRKTSGASPSTGTMGTILDATLQPKIFDFSKKNQSEWKRFVKSVAYMQSDKAKKDNAEAYLTNWEKAIKTNLGQQGLFLIDLAKQMGALKLGELALSEDEFTIGFHYGPQARENKIVEIALAFERHGITSTQAKEAIATLEPSYFTQEDIFKE